MPSRKDRQSQRRKELQLPVDTKLEKGIAHVTLNHPPVNAFDSDGWFEIADLFRKLGRDQNLNVVLLSAAGRGFCAGVDIKELQADSSAITKVNKGCYEAFAAIHDCEIPVITAVHGFNLGGGIGLAGASDIIFASDDATFGLPEIDRGALGAATHLLRMFPIQKVRKMLLTGEPISATEAYRLGALEAVTTRDELLPTAMKVAESIASKSGKAVRLAKESLNGIELLDIKRSYRYEQGFTLELYTSPDSQEARNAFVEKRDAAFARETDSKKSK